MEEVPIYHKVTITVQEATKLTNIGRDKIYELTKERDCDFTISSGRKILIKREQFIKYLSRKSVI